MLLKSNGLLFRRKADFSQEISKQEVAKFEGHMMGVVDVKFNTAGNSKR